MNLSDHFLDRELQVDNVPDESIVDNAKWLCENILEAVHAQWGAVYVTSGYRSAAKNKNAGGVETSFHLYVGKRCAADFFLHDYNVERVFDWLRLESKLPFDKVILEVDKETGKPEVIHIQADPELTRPRTAWRGQTHGTGTYTEVECV